MQYDTTTILTGIFLIFLLSYILITFFNILYINLFRIEPKVKFAKTLLASAIVTLAWIASTVIAIWVTASIGVLVFSIFALVLIFGFNYLLAEKLFGLTKKHRYIYPLLFGLILNPGWLVLLNIL